MIKKVLLLMLLCGTTYSVEIRCKIPEWMTGILVMQQKKYPLKKILTDLFPDKAYSIDFRSREGLMFRVFHGADELPYLETGYPDYIAFALHYAEKPDLSFLLEKLSEMAVTGYKNTDFGKTENDGVIIYRSVPRRWKNIAILFDAEYPGEGVEMRVNPGKKQVKIAVVEHHLSAQKTDSEVLTELSEQSIRNFVESRPELSTKIIVKLEKEYVLAQDTYHPGLKVICLDKTILHYDLITRKKVVKYRVLMGR